MISNRSKIIAYTLLCVAAPLGFKYLRKKKYQALEQNIIVIDDSEDKLIFFTPANDACKQHIYKMLTCSDSCSYKYLTTIVEFIETAEHTINICMCLLTLNQVQDAMVKARKRGVMVRFIGDFEMMRNAAACVNHLKHNGILIKTQNETSSSILHNKYCLIDEKHATNAKMFAGSLNLTCQALTVNWDFLLFTGSKRIIARFSENFEHLWDSFGFL